jgi:hypothetical protein
MLERLRRPLSRDSLPSRTPGGCDYRPRGNTPRLGRCCPLDVALLRCALSELLDGLGENIE